MQLIIPMFLKDPKVLWNPLLFPLVSLVMLSNATSVPWGNIMNGGPRGPGLLFMTLPCSPRKTLSKLLNQGGLQAQAAIAAV